MQDASPRLHARRLVVVLYVLGLVVVVAATAPRLIGDGGEYLAMAEELAAGTMPRPGATSHFWMYSVLAAPGIRAATLAGLDPLYVFGALNVALVGLAAWVAAGRLHWAAVLLLFVSPILWWIDKAHTEPFTFALVALTCLLSVDRPWWAMLAAGLAATQNPPIALVVPIIAVAAVAWRPSLVRDGRMLFALPLALALAALHPAYYLLRVGRLTNLSGNIGWHWPMAREFSTVLFDPNLGLIPAFPAVAVVTVAALVIVGVRAPATLRSPDVVVALGAFVVFSWSLTQVANVNHGGTPGMSRYGTWFIPLAIPWLAALERTSTKSRRWFVPIAMASACWCAVVYRPATPDGGTTPSRLAMWLWTKHPALDTPLPEVFTERLLGSEENWLPISTPLCEKVLVVGRGQGLGIWPVWCGPAEPPPACTTAGQLCYANRRVAGGYDFIVWRTRVPEIFRLRRELVWSPRALPTVRALVDRLGAADLSPRVVGEPGAFVLAARDVGRVFLVQSTRSALVYLDGMGSSAALTWPPAPRLSGWLVDPEDGRALRTVEATAPGEAAALDLSSLAGPLVLVLTVH